MSQLQCDIKFDKENNKILINDLFDELFSIDYSTDVDLTEFVTELSKLIDEKKEITYIIEEVEMDDKLKLIIETLEEILQSYNESIEDDVVDVDADSVTGADDFF